MSKGKWAELSSNFPDDQIEENGEIVRFGGLVACAAITETLVEMGFKVEDPDYLEVRGWELYPTKGKLRLWMRICNVEEGLYLLGVGKLGMFQTRRRRRKFVEEVLVPFNEALRKNPQFGRIAWINPADFGEGGGAYSPADPSAPEVG
jgi:hypothetical protein